MGVKSLWSLLTPVGRPVMLETMEGKVMAIDSSIWIYQFQATMRDKEGRALTNAHVLGFLRRISKLLFYGIKPVFVFDGGAPALKRSTLNERRKKKSGAAVSHTKLAEKLLSAQLRKEALKQAAKGKERAHDPTDLDNPNTVYLEDIDGSKPKGSPAKQRKPATPSKKGRFHDHDPYKLPDVDLDAIISKATQASAPDPRLATEEELRDFIEEMRPEDFDVNSPAFRELPTEVQYEIIGDLRLKSRQTSHARLQKMLKQSKTPLDFSKQQIMNLAQRNHLTQQLLVTTDTIGSAHISIPVRIASERNREYILVKNTDECGGWILGVKDPTGTRPDKPIEIDQDGKDEVSDSDTDMEEVQVPATTTLDPDLAEYQRANALAGLSKRNTSKGLESISRPVTRKRKQNVLFELNDSDLSEDELVQMTVDAEDEEEDLAFAIQASLDQTKSDSAANEQSVASSSAVTLEQSRSSNRSSNPRTPDRKVSTRAQPPAGLNDMDTPPLPSRLSTALKFAHSAHSGRKASNPSPGMFGTSSLLGSTSQSEDALPVYGGEEAAAGSESDEDMDMEPVEIAEPTVRSKEFLELFGKSQNAHAPVETKKPGRSSEFMRLFGAPGDGVEEPPGRGDVVDGQVGAVQDHPPVKGTSASGSGEAPSASLFEPSGLLGDAPAPVAAKPDTVQADVAQSPAAVAAMVPAPIVVDSDSDSDMEEIAVESPPGAPEPSPAVEAPAEIPKPTAKPTAALSSILHDEEDTAAKAQPSRPVATFTATASSLLEHQEEGAAARAQSSAATSPQPITAPLTPSAVPAAVSHSVPTSRSPSPPPQPSYRAPSPAHDDNDELDLSLDPEQSVEHTGEEHEHEHDHHDFDAANEMDVHAEEGEFANFLSQVKGRDLQQVRREIDYEIAVLNQQRKAAMRDSEDVNQQMISQIMMMLRLFGIPYITAPMEAEAQCAELVSLGLVDGVITDDSDVFLFGAARVFKNMFNQSKTVECFLSADLERELGLDRDTLVQLAYLLGSDYTDGLAGVGPVVAMELLKEFPGKDGLWKFREWWGKVQSGKDTERESGSRFRRMFKKKFKDLYLAADWPNTIVRDAYYHPVVDSSDEPFKWGLPDLDGLRGFLSEELSWSQPKVDELVLPIIQKMNKRTQANALNRQGNLNDFFNVSGSGSGTVAPRQRQAYASKRLQQVVSDFRKRRARSASEGKSREQSIAVGEEEEAEKPPARKRQRKAATGAKGKGKAARGASAQAPAGYEDTNEQENTGAPKTKRKPAASKTRKKSTTTAEGRGKGKRKADEDEDDESESGDSGSEFDENGDGAVNVDVPLKVELRPRPKPRPVKRNAKETNSEIAAAASAVNESGEEVSEAA